jgi:hypothetical protein
MNRRGFQSNVPKTLFCWVQRGPAGATVCSMHFTPFHSWGGWATFSAFALASTLTRAPRNFSTGSATRIVRCPGPSLAGRSRSTACEPRSPGTNRALALAPSQGFSASTPAKSAWKTTSPRRSAAIPAAAAIERRAIAEIPRLILPTMHLHSSEFSGDRASSCTHRPSPQPSPRGRGSDRKRPLRVARHLLITMIATSALRFGSSRTSTSASVSRAIR